MFTIEAGSLWGEEQNVTLKFYNTDRKNPVGSRLPLKGAQGFVVNTCFAICNNTGVNEFTLERHFVR